MYDVSGWSGGTILGGFHGRIASLHGIGEGGPSMLVYLSSEMERWGEFHDANHDRRQALERNTRWAYHAVGKYK